MKRDFADVSEYGQQNAETPDVERRMRMPPHVHDLALKNVLCARGMQRIDLRVLGPIQIVDVVTLDGLVEKRQPQSQHKQSDDEEFPAQEIKIPGAASQFDGRMSTSTMRDDDLDRELRAHLDLEAEELR